MLMAQADAALEESPDQEKLVAVHGKPTPRPYPYPYSYPYAYPWPEPQP